MIGVSVLNTSEVVCLHLIRVQADSIRAEERTECFIFGVGVEQLTEGARGDLGHLNQWSVDTTYGVVATVPPIVITTPSTVAGTVTSLPTALYFPVLLRRRPECRKIR
ncbi:MAG TPA: hypothetical protein EYQ01_07545 [Nitrospira sp.]|nr:hypothetical protein [Candidatus Manganitrophaceae bacterium]